jgi:putative endonuclease
MHVRGRLIHRFGTLLGGYIAVETEVIARRLERYFKSGSGKAFAKKRFW